MPIRVLILIKEEQKGAIQSIASLLSEAGLEVTQIYDKYRYIAGRIEPEKMDILREVQGVETVNPEGNRNVP